MTAIIFLEPKETSRRAEKEYLADGAKALDPIAYLTSKLEQIADENGVISRIEVGNKGKLGISFRAFVDTKKLAKLRNNAGRS